MIVVVFCPTDASLGDEPHNWAGEDLPRLGVLAVFGQGVHIVYKER
jgi:hypothetical protein